MTGAPRRRPLYARMLRLRQIQLSGLLCFVFLEGMLAVGVLLALAELVSWWAVPVLPAAVAAMVKLNDLVAGGGAGFRSNRPATGARPDAAPVGRAGSGLEGGMADVDQVAHGARSSSTLDPPAARGVRQVSRDLADTLDPVDSPQQRSRQSASRRYQ